MAKRIDRISVLFVLPSLQGGGAERVVLTILRHLDRSQIEPSLAVVDGRDPVLLSDLPNDVEVIDLKCTRVRYSVAAITRLIWKRRPDVVFTVLGHLNLLLALLKPLLPQTTKLIVRETIVISHNLVGNWLSWVWKLAYRLLLPRCDVVICQSEDMKSDLEGILGSRLTNLIVLPNPVDIEKIRASSATVEQAAPARSSYGHFDAIQLIAAGRLVWQKGFDLLIEAIALTNNQFEVTIVGDGKLRAELEHLARELGVASRVHFSGFVRNPYPMIRCADAFVLSSRFEGMPNVVLEALACGTGVIALPAPGGIDELLEGRPRCAIAKSVSARGLADALEAYDFSVRRQRVSFALDEYSAETICVRYANVLLDTVSRLR